VYVRAEGSAYGRKRGAQETLPKRMILQKKDESNQQTGSKNEYGYKNADNDFGPAPRRGQRFRIRLVIIIGRYGCSTQNACPNVMKS
jgi:hypothetical protein